jgi:hypothetical protein
LKRFINSEINIKYHLGSIKEQTFKFISSCVNPISICITFTYGLTQGTISKFDFHSITVETTGTESTVPIETSTVSAPQTTSQSLPGNFSNSFFSSMPNF